MSIRSQALIAVIALLAISCVSSGTAHHQPGPFPDARGADDVVAAPELSRFTSATSLTTVLEQARPWFVHHRGSTPMVSVDGSPPMTLASLPLIRVADVREIRLVHDRPRIMPNGDVGVGDVILVSTRRN